MMLSASASASSTLDNERDREVGKVHFHTLCLLVYRVYLNFLHLRRPFHGSETNLLLHLILLMCYLHWSSLFSTEPEQILLSEAVIRHTFSSRFIEQLSGHGTTRPQQIAQQLPALTSPPIVRVAPSTQTQYSFRCAYTSPLTPRR